MRLLEELSPRLKKARELSSFERLAEVYAALPPTGCDKCGQCCRQGPEIYYVEFLNTLHHVLPFPRERYQEIARRTVKFHLLGLADETLSCPFLEQEQCSIYPVRWFVCRWWGLEEEADFLRRRQKERRDLAREELIRRFKERYQLDLSAAAKAAELSFCRKVVVTAGEHPSQSRKNALLSEIIQLDQELLPLGTIMRQLNYLDFSSHFCSLFFSPGEMAHLRLQALKEFLAHGRSPLAEELADRIAQMEIIVEKESS